MNMKLLGNAAVSLIATAAFYNKVVRPRINAWGTTDEELRASLPLDERVQDPRFVQQLAVTIDATPDAIWPWIVQLGEPPRAGYYSFTSIEKLMGLDVVNQERILPEFQEVHVGEALDKNGTMVVQAVEPRHYMVLGPPASVSEVQATWTFYLQPIDDHSTRLISRCRADWDLKNTLTTSDPMLWAMTLMIEPGAFIMTWKMLKTIKRLAETHDLQPDVAFTPTAFAREAA